MSCAVSYCPLFEQALRTVGVNETDALMAQLCGNEDINAVDAVYRQQLTRQVFTPLVLQLLKAYENYDPEYPRCSRRTVMLRKTGA